MFIFILRKLYAVYTTLFSSMPKKIESVIGAEAEATESEKNNGRMRGIK